MDCSWIEYDSRGLSDKEVWIVYESRVKWGKYALMFRLNICNILFYKNFETECTVGSGGEREDKGWFKGSCRARFSSLLLMCWVWFIIIYQLEGRFFLRASIVSGNILWGKWDVFKFTTWRWNKLNS